MLNNLLSVFGYRLAKISEAKQQIVQLDGYVVTPIRARYKSPSGLMTAEGAHGITLSMLAKEAARYAQIRQVSGSPAEYEATITILTPKAQ